MKRLINRVLKLTPYTITRRDTAERQAQYDAIAHNSMENMNKLFSDQAVLAGYFSASRQRLHRATLTLIEEAKPANGSGGVVGDFGCGPGDFFALMGGAYGAYDFYGYDFSEAALSAARTRFPRGTYQTHDLYTQAPRRHDITICSQTLEHLLDPELALSNLIAATNPGGLVVVTVPDGRRDTYKGHINFWSAESWNAWMARVTRLPHYTRRIEQGTAGGANLAAVITT